MHELSLAESLVDLVEERLAASDLAGRTVVAAHLRVGRACGVLPEALAFCWQAVTTGTSMDGSRLVLEQVPGDELVLTSLELSKREPSKREPSKREPSKEESCAPRVAAAKRA